MRRFVMVIVALAAAVVMASGVLACDGNSPGCDDEHHIDVRGLLKLACDSGDPSCSSDHHIDVRGLLKLACDSNDPGCADEHHIDVRGLLKLACDGGNSNCDGDHHRDLPGGRRIASATGAKKLTFMAIPKSVNRDALTRRLSARSRALERRSLTPGSDTASLGSTEPKNPRRKPSLKADAVERLRKADPNDFPVLMGFLQKRIPVDAKDSHGNTLLMAASSRGNLPMVKLLLEKGADVKPMARNGGTALMYAAAQGHTDVVKELLKAGADPNRKNESGASALFWAKKKGHLDVVKIFEAAGVKK